ncbi:2,3-dehydroadipyl-CoA hydratase [Sphaerisporangium rufum]|uniref:2,3-dehydroadipyl-CoA hydratase n=1 Tax=Sphaerisporangium rufum TaxID=1381558 RepID=A0A919R7A7_9ACTN|nr:enoyl-CoA hydratase/isomerase family protein [Sphaerisporangium rufum]GII78545.1 2,3-dehydroadipyl-CoA hydratase [Sphaerisporangium rufum]
MSAVAAPAGRFTAVLLDGRTATVTWSRPERRNAIGAEVCAELVPALTGLAGRRDVDVVVLRAAGRPFCAGWDVTDFAGLAGASPGELAAFFRHGRRLLAAIGALPQVTVAAPAGAALGFGCALLARCDLVVAADDCRFGLPEITLGMPPATVLPELLRVMTRRAALAWAVTGERLPAHRALADGLVTSVVPAAAHEEETAALAAALAGRRPGVVRDTKALAGRLAAAGEEDRTALGMASAIARFTASEGEAR